MTSIAQPSPEHAPRRGRAFRIALLVGALTVASTSAVHGDDAALFSTTVSPNVMIVVDTSGSMANVVWHPAYDPTVPSATSGCEFWEDDTTYFVWNGYDWDGTAADNTLETGTTAYDGTCSNSGREVFEDSEVDAKGLDTRFTGHYLNWYFSDAVEQNYDLDGDGTADGTILSQIKATNNGKVSACLGSGTFDRFRRSRITAAKQILKDVICKVNQSGDVRFGIAQFRAAWNDGVDFDANGGFVSVPINDYYDSAGDPYTYNLAGVTASHETHIDNALGALSPSSWTPLSETLFQIYTYFMSRDSSHRDFGANGGTFPEYEYATTHAGAGGEFSSTAAPPSPVEEWCQKNFVILLTDGVPAQDNFDTHFSHTNEDKGFDAFTGLIGDYNLPGDEAEEPLTFGDCDECEPSLYLDDIAKFMAEQDHQPDESKYPGTQTIDVYTVGFTTGDDANGLLKRAAQAGNGKAFTTNNAEELTDAIIKSVTDIIEKSQSFAAGNIPASRSNDGNNFYISYFTPSRTPFWEGHLKAYEFNRAGEIRDATGNCALADPNAPASCNQGTLLLNSPAFWDAAEVIPPSDESVTGARELYVSNYNAPPSSPAAPPLFKTSTVDDAALGLLPADFLDDLVEFSTAGLSVSGIGDSNELADAVVNWVRGCEFNDPTDGCKDRGPLNKLHDIFHSTPIVVGPPNSGNSGEAYREFRNKYSTRKRVLYAGSNGGFLHGFNVGEWRTTATAQVPNPPGYDRGTGVEEFGFMPYVARQNIAKLPLDNRRDYYFVDGAPAAADVWMPPSATAAPGDATSWDEWRTVLIGGMRQGGNSYYALDVTNPDGITSGPGYPLYMWEFPCEASSCDGDRMYMGETWSEPIITKVKATVDCSGPTCANHDRWVAIVGAGYASSGDPNDTANYDATSTAGTNREGRAILMIDIATGEVLAAKRFDHSASTAEADMKYAFASTPAVFDLDFDGYADVVYIGDLGGNLWKWVLKGPAEDHIRGSGGDEDQTHWPFLRFFSATPCGGSDCSPTHYKPIYFPPTGTLYRGRLILGFGTGDRQRLNDVGSVAADRNRYYVLRDHDVYEKSSSLPAGARFDDDPASSPADVVNRTSLQISGGCVPPPNTAIGFYVEGEDGEKFITSSQIFFGLLLTGSYVPNGSGDPCDGVGTAYLYGFDLACGVGGLPDPVDPTTNPPDERIPVGPGLPNPPRVSVGALDEQDPDNPDDCDNVVMVLTSDNEAVRQNPVCAPSSGVRVRSWKNE